MLLTSIRIKNFSSIVDSGIIRIEKLQSFVGENNAGKSNILKAIDVFLSSGASGVQENSFFNKENPIVITCEFSQISNEERRKLRKYLINDTLILEKQFQRLVDGKTSKVKINAEYHGYIANPKDWWLSIEQIIEKEGPRPDWKGIAETNGILSYVQLDDGKVNKQSYESGISRFLEENEDIEFLCPIRGETQTLGLQPVLLDILPTLYLLPAITDYSDEIDRRTTTTVFRRLMIDLSNRIIQNDPNYQQVVIALNTIKNLFNPIAASTTEGVNRLETLKSIEKLLHEKISTLNPDVNSVHMRVDIDEPKDFFARGVSLQIDDGVLTDVIDKGNGLQRSVIFGLLQALIDSNKQEQSTDDKKVLSPKPIILSIEEPELYIHPQLQRMIYRTLEKLLV